MAFLAAFFFAVAVCYSSVGFGGGSSYTAILAWQGGDVDAIRQVSLLCNLVVVLIGGLAGLGRLRMDLLGPLLVTSVPAAFLGAFWRIDEQVFFGVLAAALAVSGILLLWKIDAVAQSRKLPLSVLLFLGTLLGGLAGVTGIGGGIYLAPALYLLRAGEAREVAAVATWFILANSLVGFVTLSMRVGLEPLSGFWWLPVAVAAGALIGSRLLQGVFSAVVIRRVTGTLILVVAGRILLQQL